MCRERLLQRIRGRGIPPAVVRWIEAFCTSRSASIAINSHTTSQYPLTQATLPQGSPLAQSCSYSFTLILSSERSTRLGAHSLCGLIKRLGHRRVGGSESIGHRSDHRTSAGVGNTERGRIRVRKDCNHSLHQKESERPRYHTS